MASIPTTVQICRSLHNALRPDHWEGATHQVLQYLVDGPAGLRQQFQRAIPPTLRVPGYRGVLKAPPALVAPIVADGAKASPRLTLGLLGIWVAMHGDLREDLEAFLAEHPLSGAASGAQEWPVDEVLGHADAYLSAHDGVARDDVGLMICYLTWIAPVIERVAGGEGGTAAPVAESRAPQALIWDAWIASLRALPADAPEWQAVDDLIATVRQIAEEKRGDRAARDRLAEQVAALQQDSEALEFFRWPTLPDASAAACPPDAVSATTEDLQALLTRLAEHRLLRAQQPATAAETDTWLERRQALLHEVRSLGTRVLERLTPAPEAARGADMPGAAAASPDGEAQEELAQPEEDSDASGQAAVRATGKAPPGGDARGGMEALEAAESPVAEDTAAAAGGVGGPEDDGAPDDGQHAARQPPAAVADLAHPTASDAGADLPEASIEPVGAAWNSQRAALAVQSGEDVARWDDFLWALVGEDDLAGAYWLSASLAARGLTPAVPEWLLQALLGARWLGPGHDAFQAELLELTKAHDAPADPAARGLALAAALRTVLIAPSAGLAGWLEDPGWSEGLYDIASAVEEYVRAVGVPLRAEDVLGAAGESQVESLILKAAERARVWLHEVAPNRRVKYYNANSMWLHLIGASGELHALLLPAAQDRRERASEVAAAVGRWRDADYREERVRLADEAVARAKYRKTVGAALKQLYRYIDDACTLAWEWSALVLRRQEVAARGNWLVDQVAELQRAVAAAAPAAVHDLRQVLLSADPAGQAVAACLLRSLAQVGELLQVPAACVPLPSAPVYPVPPDASRLADALASRTMWLPEIRLTSGGAPEPDALPQVADALAATAAEQRSAEAVLSLWLDKQDYRFVSAIMPCVRGTAAEAFVRRVAEAMQGSRAALVDAMVAARNEIEQALVDGVIGEEHIEYVADVDGIDVERVQDFSGAFRRLDTVREALRERRQERLADLHQQWQAIDEALERRGEHPEPVAAIRRSVQRAFQDEDTRVVEEAIASLRETEGRLGDWVVGQGNAACTRDVLDEFVAAAPEIERWLAEHSGLGVLSKNISAGRTRVGMSFGALASTRREEASQAVLAWQHLKQRRPSHGDIPNQMGIVLSFLGFALNAGGTPIREERRGADWLHLRASMSASGLAKPIPQFGHLAEGQYHVVCFWERPGADTITARLSELRLSVQTVLVVYLGRLTAKQRRDVSRAFRQQSLSAAVLDEVLLAFLAQEEDARLSPFLRCALPYSALNPYTPFQAGDVPPEMFFGRQEMTAALQDGAGPCLVYGGRQLGKSALLRHVQRQFDHPNIEQYAWVENLKLIYEPQEGDSPDRLWVALREQMAKRGLLSSRLRSEQPSDIRRQIREGVLGAPGRRVLVMLDEADQFLDADARQDFRVVTGLRELMVDTGRRFKVVFAGLHSVQRFQGIPDQPLAHFGSPIRVGPLEAAAARDLVREPLAALGYHFEDESVILRILSYTNYHPGLVQLFCQELLKELLARTQDSLPPYTVRRQDVEAVYRRSDVREHIRERFDWTLALDPRYQAIAWSLIVEQMAQHDSYALAFAPGEILTQVRGWWPAAFATVPGDEFRGLLEELVGLGVLARNADGHYRLRSPNLVRLMGTEQDIEDRLLELAAKDPPQPPDADNLHGRPRTAPRCYSPLTYAQERMLAASRSGVGLVHASEAGGSASMVDAFRRFLPAEAREEILFEQIPVTVTNGKRLEQWLAGQAVRLRAAEQGIIYGILNMRGTEALCSLVETAVRHCQRRRPRDRWLRILFVLRPQATWAWLGADEERRLTLESQVAVVTHSRPWNGNAIRHLLTQHDMMDTEDICAQVQEATGGWHMLVQRLLSYPTRSGDPRPAAHEIATDLNTPASALLSEFLAGLGLDAAPGAMGVITQVAKALETPVLPLHILSPDVLADGQTTPTVEACGRLAPFLERMACATVCDGKDLVIDPLVYRVLAQQP